jgi:hypothetical protein
MVNIFKKCCMGFIFFINLTKREYCRIKKDISPECGIVESGSGGIAF